MRGGGLHSRVSTAPSRGKSGVPPYDASLHRSQGPSRAFPHGRAPMGLPFVLMVIFFGSIQARAVQGIERRLFVRCSGRIPHGQVFLPRRYLIDSASEFAPRATKYRIVAARRAARCSADSPRAAVPLAHSAGQHTKGIPQQTALQAAARAFGTALRAARCRANSSPASASRSKAANKP